MNSIDIERKKKEKKNEKGEREGENASLSNSCLGVIYCWLLILLEES